MNKLTRLLTVTGMGALTALAIGAGPAQAAGTTGSAAAKPSAGQAQQRHGSDRTIGYYRSARACEMAGRIGERFGRWDDHDCELVRFGFRRGSWALEIGRDRDRGHSGHGMPGHNWPSSHGPSSHGPSSHGPSSHGHSPIHHFPGR
jgi:hypothetical protein